MPDDDELEIEIAPGAYAAEGAGAETPAIADERPADDPEPEDHEA